MRIAICDDEAYWINELLGLLREYYITRRINLYFSLFSSGTELLKSRESFDVIFMDYQMEEINGIETAREIRARNISCAIIFVSSYPDIAIDTFEVDTYRFLVKPINKDKLFGSLDDYRKKINGDDFIVLKNRENETILKASEVIFCEAKGKHSVLHTLKGTFESSKNIKEIEAQLTKDYFFRCHKAYIVSFDYIKSFDNSCVTLEDGSTAYISRNYLPKFKTSFQEYILKHNLRKI